jgi:uncharacterized protein YkwD
MVRRRYFSHDTKGGRSWDARIRRTGYGRGARSWRVGETLTWAGGSYTSALSRLAAWLRSPSHRKVLLTRQFRDVGFGIVLRTPKGGRGATVTADFGREG